MGPNIFQAPNNRLRNVGHKVPSLVAIIHNLNCSKYRHHILSVLIGGGCIAFSIAVAITFVSTMTEANKQDVYELKYDKPFVAELLNSSSQIYKQEKETVKPEIINFLSNQLPSLNNEATKSQHLNVTILSFRNESTVVSFYVGSPVFSSSSIKSAFLTFNADDDVFISGARVLSISNMT